MKRQFTFHRLLFALIFVTGLFLVFVPPPFQKADEYAHFRRSLMLSEGIVLCNPKQTTPVRQDLYSLFNNPIINRLTYDKTSTLDFSRYLNHVLKDEADRSKHQLEVTDLCTYPFVSYIPQAFSLFIFTKLSLNAYILFFAGRLTVFLCCFILLLYLFKKTPNPFNYIILFVFSLPMSLYQMTSYSYDALQIVLLLFYFSYLIQLMKTKKIQFFQITVLNVLLFLFLLSKPGGYEFLVLTAFLIPIQKKQYIYLLGITTLFTSLYFLLRISLYQHVAAMSFQNGINPSLQLQYLLNPVFDVFLIIKTTFHHAWFYSKGLIGIFGWLEYGLNAVVYVCYALAALLILNMRHSVTLNRFQKILLSISLFITYCFLLGINYLFWTKPGSLIVDGVQGRYFIPLLPFLFLLAYSFLKKPFLQFQNKPQLIKLVVILFAFYISFSIIISVIMRYYS